MEFSIFTTKPRCLYIIGLNNINIRINYYEMMRDTEILIFAASWYATDLSRRFLGSAKPILGKKLFIPKRLSHKYAVKTVNFCWLIKFQSRKNHFRHIE